MVVNKKGHYCPHHSHFHAIRLLRCSCNHFFPQKQARFENTKCQSLNCFNLAFSRIYSRNTEETLLFQSEWAPDHVMYLKDVNGTHFCLLSENGGMVFVPTATDICQALMASSLHRHVIKGYRMKVMVIKIMLNNLPIYLLT